MRTFLVVGDIKKAEEQFFSEFKKVKNKNEDGYIQTQDENGYIILVKGEPIRLFTAKNGSTTAPTGVAGILFFPNESGDKLLASTPKTEELHLNIINPVQLIKTLIAKIKQEAQINNLYSKPRKIVSFAEMEQKGQEERLKQEKKAQEEKLKQEKKAKEEQLKKEQKAREEKLKQEKKTQENFINFIKSEFKQRSKWVFWKKPKIEVLEMQEMPNYSKKMPSHS